MTGLWGATSFLAAALLFLVQPMVGRMVLPAFGGSPQVWTTSMLFFQVALLAGYAYAHASTASLRPTRQPWAHLGLALLALPFLPIQVNPLPSGAGGAAPIGELLGGLVRGVGAPFFLAAASGPLLQRWLSWTDHPRARDPYFLYAAGNFGSVAGLIAYPFLLEPRLTLAAQSALWAGGYVVVLVLLALCAAQLRRHPGGPPAHAAVAPQPRARIGVERALSWAGCAFVPSSLMLGATAMISTDIAAVPLLWMIPLGLYLLTFTAAFSRWGEPALRVARVLALPTVMLALVVDARSFGVGAAFAVQLALVVIGGLVGHGRLAADRPDPALLTRFYLTVGAGGALGGVFNGIVAPLAFPDLFEHGLAAAALAALAVPWRRPLLDLRSGWKGRRDLAVALGLGWLAAWLIVRSRSAGGADWAAWRWLFAIAAVTPLLTRWARHPIATLVAATLAIAIPLSEMRRAELTTRTFFGRYQVTLTDGVARLVNGTTQHGTQNQRTAQARLRPLSYYDPAGPLGWVLAGEPGDIGVIGLGTGAVAAYGRPGQTVVFHEIDPEVVDIARRWFSYLADSKATVEIVPGDGRLTVARVPGRYDVLLVDGFTSDAIPMHLLTVEALATYLDAVGDRGLVAVHITNRFVGLEPVMKGAGERLGIDVLGAAGVSEDDITSVWVVLSRNGDRLRRLRAAGWSDLTGPSVVWTDQRASLVSVLK